MKAQYQGAGDMKAQHQGAGDLKAQHKGVVGMEWHPEVVDMEY